MAKKIDGYINLQVPAGAANPSPPIGPALGQRGVNIMEFCKSFNAKTKDLEQGTPIPVKITVFSDRSFTFEMRTPPATFLIKKAAGMKPTGKPGSGSKNPGRDVAGHHEPGQPAATEPGQLRGELVLQVRHRQRILSEQHAHGAWREVP